MKSSNLTTVPITMQNQLYNTHPVANKNVQNQRINGSKCFYYKCFKKKKKNHLPKSVVLLTPLITNPFLDWKIQTGTHILLTKNLKPKTQKQEASTKAKMKQNHTTHTDIYIYIYKIKQQIGYRNIESLKQKSLNASSKFEDFVLLGLLFLP